MSITSNLSERALGLTYEDLPSDVVQYAKRIVTDTLACLIGGLNSPTGRICRSVAKTMGGSAQATIIGDGSKVSCGAAILANQAMIRYLDYNDCLSIYRSPADLVSTHPSGAIPVALAVSEWTGASGKQFLEAMIAGYETIGHILASMETSLETRGFHHAAVLAYAGAAMAGRLLRLSHEQMTNAMGIAGSLTLGLNILDADGEEYVMTKNIVDGLCAERGLVGALLAQQGFTGPERVIEGNRGFAEVALGGREMYKQRCDEGHYYVLDAEMKATCAEATTHGFIAATAALVKESGLVADDVERVTIRVNKRTATHCGDPIKKYPKNKETADHSAYYLTAMTILEGQVTPRIYEKEKFSDPKVIALIDKIDLEHGPEFDPIPPSAEVIVRTRSGARHSKRVEREEIKGLSENPLSDGDVRDKFFECADGLMSAEEIERAIEACGNMENLDKFADLMPFLMARASTEPYL